MKGSMVAQRKSLSHINPIMQHQHTSDIMASSESNFTANDREHSTTVQNPFSHVQLDPQMCKCLQSKCIFANFSIHCTSVLLLKKNFECRAFTCKLLNCSIATITFIAYMIRILITSLTMINYTGKNKQLPCPRHVLIPSSSYAVDF